MKSAPALPALPAFLRDLSPDDACDGLAKGTLTPADVLAAMRHRDAMSKLEVEGSDEHLAQMRWAIQLAVLVAPYFHDELPPVVNIVSKVE